MERKTLTAFLLIITVLMILKDNFDTKKKWRENQAAARNWTESFNEYMQTLKDIQGKDYTKKD